MHTLTQSLWAHSGALREHPKTTQRPHQSIPMFAACHFFTSGPIDGTPGIPGSDKDDNLSHLNF